MGWCDDMTCHGLVQDSVETATNNLKLSSWKVLSRQPSSYGKDFYWAVQMVLRSQPKAISKQSFAHGSEQLMTTKWSGQHHNMGRLKLQMLQPFMHFTRPCESCEGNWFSQASVIVLLDNSAKGFVARAVAYRIELQTFKRQLSQQIFAWMSKEIGWFYWNIRNRTLLDQPDAWARTKIEPRSSEEEAPKCCFRSPRSACRFFHDSRWKYCKTHLIQDRRSLPS